MGRNTTELKEKAAERRELDFLQRIAEHVAKGDTFDETLATAIDFAIWLVCCDECIAYVREGEQLVPWVWKYSKDKSVEHSRFSVGDGHIQILSEHLEPIAVSSGVDTTSSQVKHFSGWSIHPGETSVWIPLEARSELLGTLHLRHRNAHTYSLREIKLLSSMGRILAADIRISDLKSKHSELLLQLETRKLIERGKGILQRDLGLSEEEACLALQRESRRKSLPMKRICFP
jgi:transcriptional regulator with GAF, ATPase, and Fis domain